MTNDTEIVKAWYDQEYESEWNRIANRPEFIITCRFLDRYIKKGDRVLDIGGGPGRYSLYLAKKGCDVTLFDLSSKNISYALEQAKLQNLSIKTVCGNACVADTLVSGEFDHVLLMGPLYHLLEESDRVRAVESSLRLLKSGGVLYTSFINLFAGMIYAMKHDPQIINSVVESEVEYKQCVLDNKSFGGDAFTRAFFIAQDQVLPFMERFPLQKLHLIGQEGIASPCEETIISQPQEVVDGWMDICERLAEREDLLSYSEHLMYIGRKIA